MTDAPASTAVRPSPLDRAHTAAGAQFTDFGGWRMPLRYGSELDEHRAVRERAGLFDLSHMAEIAVIGPGAAVALDFALAGRLSALTLGQAKYSLLLSPEGGILDDVIVYRTGEDRYLVVANAANREVAVAELRERSASFECTVQDETEDIALLALQGPRAAEILDGLEGLDPDGGLDAVRALKYYRAVAGEWDGHSVLIARTGYTGEDGFELYLSPDTAPALWTVLLETGRGAGLVPAGLAARDTLRLEAGMPLYGHELGVDTLPAQAGLGRVVALSKEGDFVGRAAIEASSPPTAESSPPTAESSPPMAEPVEAPRVLVGLASEGRRAGRAGYPVLRDDTVVGAVTSGALSPTLGHPIAMAYVDPSAAEPGTVLALDVRGTHLPATVVPLPFYRRPAAS